MPASIRRPHDGLLRLVLDPEVVDSRLVVVRGDACAGKSRSACEAVAGRLADWAAGAPDTHGIAACVPVPDCRVRGVLARGGGGMAEQPALGFGGLLRQLRADALLTLASRCTSDWSDPYL